MIHLLSPGDPRQRTGGYLYNARLVQGLRARGHEVRVHVLEGRWPIPEDPARLAAEIAALPPGPLVADGLMWTGLADHVSRPTLVLVHSPLWRELGASLEAPERAALARAGVVVCTSHQTARDLRQADAHILEPGTDRPAQLAQPQAGRGRLLCVATVTPRKGHDVLLDALAQLEAPVTLACAGSLDRDPAWAHALQARSPAHVSWLGDLDEAQLAAAWSQADVLVHAAHYEGWGMALAEGVVRGLPVVSTPAGVFEGRPGGRIEVPPGDASALAAALTRVLTDAALADRLAAEARALPLPTWDTQITTFEACLAALEGP